MQPGSVCEIIKTPEPRSSLMTQARYRLLGKLLLGQQVQWTRQCARGKLLF